MDSTTPGRGRGPRRMQVCPLDGQRASSLAAPSGIARKGCRRHWGVTGRPVRRQPGRSCWRGTLPRQTSSAARGPDLAERLAPTPNEVVDATPGRWPRAPARTQRHRARLRTGFSALVRGRVWYLSMPLRAPWRARREPGAGAARAGAGLRPKARGAEIRCTLATLDPRAQARYVMAGMAPRWPIYSLDGDAAAVTRLEARPGSTRGAGAAVRSRRRREADRRGLRPWPRRRPGPLPGRRRCGGGDRARGRARRLRLPAGAADRASGRARRDGFPPGGGGRGGGRRGWRESVTDTRPGACASLLEALVSCGFRIGGPDAVHGLAAVRPTRALPPLGAHTLLGCCCDLVEGRTPFFRGRHAYQAINFRQKPRGCSTSGGSPRSSRR